MTTTNSQPPQDAPEPPPPKRYAFDWQQLLDAIGLDNSSESRSAVRRAARVFGGPIAFRQGSPPFVGIDALLAWWNGLEARAAELAQGRAERGASEAARQASAADAHPYGRNGTVAPGISGGVRRRRSSAR